MAPAAPVPPRFPAPPMSEADLAAQVARINAEAMADTPAARSAGKERRDLLATGAETGAGATAFARPPAPAAALHARERRYGSRRSIGPH